MTTPDWIRLALTLTAATLSVCAAILARRNAHTAREHAQRARRNERQAWGDAARAELATMKIRQAKRRP